MVDIHIQSPTAENRRGKKEEKRKTKNTAAKYNGLPITMGGHSKNITRPTGLIVFVMYYVPEVREVGD